MRTEHLWLPDEDGVWGSYEVTKADSRAGAAYSDLDEPDEGLTKTGLERYVPLHPLEVAVLRPAVARVGSGLLWLTRAGNLPNPSNWNRAWQRARTGTPYEWMRIYDLRHTHATIAIGRMPLGELADRLGHSPETLTRTYVGALETDRDLGNERMDDAFG